MRDIADFAKYGLLKRLVADDLRLGVLWYLTTHATGGTPLVSYLRRRADYAPCDPALFDALHALHLERGDDAAIVDVEQRGILPPKTSFFSVPLATTPLPLSQREDARRRWFAAGIETTASADVVFLDPDTGVLGVGRRTTKPRDEYAFVHEIKTVLDSGRSAVCIQFGKPGNLERGEPTHARAQMRMLEQELVAAGHPKPFGLWWRDHHKVGFIVAPSPEHEAVLKGRALETLAQPAWAARVSAL